MTQIVAALFETYDDAAEAVRRLEAAGISYRDLSIVSNADNERHLVRFGTTDQASEGARTGLGVGAALGGTAGLLAVLGLVAVPGLGPMVAAGWLAATATGAAVGASAGGIVGALTTAGLSDEDAQIFAGGLSRGGTIVTARVSEEQLPTVRSILSESNAADLRATGDGSPRRVSLSADRTAGASDLHQASDAQVGGGAERRARADTDRSAKEPGHRLIASDRVRGVSVYDRNGKHIGAVERLVIDKATGQVAYVVMSFGGFLGMGSDTERLPWDELEYDVSLEGYRTRITEDQVRGGRS